MPANPFRFGSPVDQALLIDREAERERILTLLLEARNLALVGPRGIGKSSLLAAVARAGAKGKMDLAYVDLLPALNPRRFAELYASALTLSPSRTMQDTQEALRQLIPNFSPRVTLSGEGRPALQLDLWDRERDIQALMDRIFEVPAEMQSRSGRPLTVIFDDFEDLIAVAQPGLLREVANAARKQIHVSYVFVLRKDTTIERLFEEPHSPFYRLAESMRLEPVPRGAMVEGLEQLFVERGVGIEHALLHELLRLADTIPHYVQMLAHSLYEQAQEKGTATSDDLKAALSHVLEGQAYAFKFQWDQLSAHQKTLALAIAQGFTEKLHSQRMVVRLGLGSPSTVAKNLRVLSEREILNRNGADIRFVDPFFGLWLQRRMS